MIKDKAEIRRTTAILHGLRLYRNKVGFNSTNGDAITRQYFKEEVRMTDNLIIKYVNILNKLNGE